MCEQDTPKIRIATVTNFLHGNDDIDIALAETRAAIDAGADFIKTSTGKVPVNATSEVAQIMMNVIRDKGLKEKVGFKPTGGVRSVEDAAIYLKRADDILGEGWADARHFRFGAASLLASLLNALGHQTAASKAGH